MPTDARHRCCLCGTEIRGKPVKLTPDANGKVILPPGCAKVAADCDAPTSEWLHKQSGKWCATAVFNERAQIRSSGAMIKRNDYDPGAALAHNQAPRTERELKNLVIDDLSFKDTLPMVFLKNKEMQHGQGEDESRTTCGNIARQDDTGAPRTEAKQNRRQSEHAPTSVLDKLPSTVEAETLLPGHVRGGYANAARVRMAQEALGELPSRPRAPPQTLSQRVDPSSTTQLRWLSEEERIVRDRLSAQRDELKGAAKELSKAEIARERAEEVAGEASIFLKAASKCHAHELWCDCHAHTCSLLKLYSSPKMTPCTHS
jgi:hypothetical protein